MADAAAIESLMKDSIAGLGPATYDTRQVASAVRYIANPDTQLIADRTYFVAFDGEEMVGCGGWSHRAKFFTGGDVEADPRSLDPASEAARIRAMFVRSDQARRGIGRAILAACEEEARQAGFRTLELMATLASDLLDATRRMTRLVGGGEPPFEVVEGLTRSAPRL